MKPWWAGLLLVGVAHAFDVPPPKFKLSPKSICERDYRAKKETLLRMFGLKQVLPKAIQILEQLSPSNRLALEVTLKNFETEYYNALIRTALPRGEKPVIPIPEDLFAAPHLIIAALITETAKNTELPSGKNIMMEVDGIQPENLWLSQTTELSPPDPFIKQNQTWIKFASLFSLQALRFGDAIISGIDIAFRPDQPGLRFYFLGSKPPYRIQKDPGIRAPMDTSLSQLAYESMDLTCLKWIPKPESDAVDYVLPHPLTEGSTSSP